MRGARKNPQQEQEEKGENLTSRSRSTTQSSAPSLKRTAIALICAPLLLAVCVAPLIAFVTRSERLEGEALMHAIEPLTPAPISIGFGLVFLVTARLARRDGLSLAMLGWIRPSARDLIIAIAMTPVVTLAATRLAYPAVQSVRPNFDPAVPAIALGPAAVMLVAAAIAEDTLYRGYALHQLSARLGRVGAIVVTSLAYALLAPGQGWPLVVFAFFLGTTLCAIRLASSSLLPVVWLHGATALAPKIEAVMARTP